MTDSTLETVLRRDRRTACPALSPVDPRGRVTKASVAQQELKRRLALGETDVLERCPLIASRRDQHDCTEQIAGVLWIALLALLVLLEKLTLFGRWIARAAGIACVTAGAWLLVSLPL